MRIVFEENIQGIKVTGFEYESKYSLKYEQYHLEQWYKFRDGAVADIDTLKSVVSVTLLPGVADRFQQMLGEQSSAILKAKGFEESQYPDII